MLLSPLRRRNPFLITLLCLAGLPLVGQQAPSSQKVAPAAAPGANTPEVLRQLNSAMEGLVARVSPAVVQVLVSGLGPVDDRDRNDTALIARQQGIGSGVIVDPDGYIMTNAHVVEGAQRIRVLLPLPPGDSPLDVAPAGKRHLVEAKLLGVHKESDLALLKIDETNLPTLPLGSDRYVRQGQLVFAIGSPEGLQNSVTMGVVSAVARQADPAKPMVYIQTDAPINPGNSGGPLVDMNGDVVGINTFILSQGGGSEGLGFAIPARVVKFVYKSLRKYGHVHRVEIKAGAQEISPDLAQGLGLAQSWGVIIDDVIPGGPADAAGLKVQDIVLSADDRRIETLPAFSAALYLHPTDQVLKLEVLRGTEKVTLHIPVLEKRDHMDALADITDRDTNLIPQLGILAVALTDQLRASLGVDLRIPTGVVVLARTAEFIGPETGLRQGDVIHTLNQRKIDSLDGLRAALHQLKPGDSVAMQIERDGGLQYVAFEME
jgi:serine protease Do